MKTIVAFCCFVTLAQAASLLPLESSVVNVKSERNGQDYSYSIQENRRGIPLEQIPVQPLTLQPIQTVLPIATAEIKTSLEQQQQLQLQQRGQGLHEIIEKQQEMKSRQPEKRVQIQQRGTILPLQDSYLPIQYATIPATYYPLAYQQYQYYYPYNIPLQQYLYKI